MQSEKARTQLGIRRDEEGCTEGCGGIANLPSMRRAAVVALCMLACLLRDVTATAPTCPADGTEKSSGICGCDGISSVRPPDRIRVQGAFAASSNALLSFRSLPFLCAPVQILRPTRMPSTCLARTTAVRYVRLRGIRRARGRFMRASEKSGDCLAGILPWRLLDIGWRGAKPGACVRGGI